MAFEVSVIIPVYNAARYVEQAVRSALDQPQTGEVLLIEDGCPDPASLPTCRRIAESDRRVRLLRHPGGKNRGAGPSRNLGIVNATCPYIAFLDADDFYLPGRFTVTEEVFRTDSGAEAVYEMTGTHFETERAREIWERQGRSPSTCIQPGIPSDRLFEEMFPIGKKGKCCLDAMTLRRDVINRIGMFPSLPIGEDTVFEMKVAAGTRWLPGQLHEPVVVRRVHEANRTTGCAVVGRAWPQSGVRHWRARMQIYLEVLKWLRTQRNQQMRIRLIPEAMRRETQNLVNHADGRMRRFGLTAFCYLVLLSRTPSLLRYPSFTRAFLRDAYTA